MGRRKNKLRQVLPKLYQILRRFRPYLRRQRGLMFRSFLALLAVSLFRLLEPWPLKFVIDYVIGAAPPGSAGALAAIDPMTLLTLSAVATVLIAVLTALCGYVSRVGFARVGNRVITELRGDLYRHLQSLSMSFHTGAKSGDLVLRVIADVNLLRDAVVTAMLPLISNLLILICMWCVMIWMDWKLSLMGLAVMPLLYLRTTQLTRRIREAAHKQRQRQGAMAATAGETMGAIKIIKALSLEGAFAEAFIQRSNKSQSEDVKMARLSASLERGVDVLLAIATAMIMWYGARLVLTQVLTPGDLIVFLVYLKRGFKPLKDFAKYSGRLAKSTAAGERVLDLLDQTPEVRDRPDAVVAPAFRGAVRFDRLSFGYVPKQAVVEGISFEVQPGQHVALVGESGIGKSTLLSLLLRLYEPIEGRVLIDNCDIREYTVKSVRSQISAVLQDTVLFAASVRDNIAYGTSDATHDRIEAAARVANAHEFIMNLPQGYDTVLSERGTTLSHGQRQRIAIARAAIHEAPILILDEPTTGLDEENELAVVDALLSVAANRTTFIVSHNLQLAARADLILHLDGGRVIEMGTHAELMKDGGRYAEIYTLQDAPGEGTKFDGAILSPTSRYLP